MGAVLSSSQCKSRSAALHHRYHDTAHHHAPLSPLPFGTVEYASSKPLANTCTQLENRSIILYNYKSLAKEDAWTK